MAPGGPLDGQYMKLPIKTFPVRSERETSEWRFWHSFKPVVNDLQIGPVTCVDFTQAQPLHVAVTSSTRVLVYDAERAKVQRTFSRFRDVAYSGTFRPDGKLLVAGGESGIVQVFDAGSRAVLRQLKGHTRAVHFTRYGRDNLHVLSASDDRSVRWWDVPTQAEVVRLEEHSDYVRSGAASPVSADLWATGSYDHTVRLWDLRSAKCVMQLQHGKPVEDVAFFPGGGLLASAGGSYVSVWDVIGGGRVLQRLTNHQKTVTSVRIASPPVLATPGAARRTASPRLLTASLDGHVKVYELDTFRVTYATLCPAPILSMAVSPSGEMLALGMADGRYQLRQRTVAPRDGGQGPSLGGGGGRRAPLPGFRPKRRRRMVARPLQASSFRYFIRGRSERASAGDYTVARQKRPRLAPHDKLLRRFRYSEALLAALQTEDAPVVISVIEELVARGGLRAAMANREASALESLLMFLVKYVANPRHSALLVQVAATLLTLYGPFFGQSPAIDRQLELLERKLTAETNLQQSLLQLQGLLQPLLQAASCGLNSL